MKKSITTLIFLMLLSLSGFSQTTFCLRLSEVSNDGDNYIVKIEMQGSELFKLGSANLQFGFPETALGAPTLESSPLGLPIYFVPTVTVPLPGQASFNIELGFPDFGSDVLAAPGWTELGQVNFPITNPDNLAPLVWSYNGGTTETVVFLDDEATQIYTTTPSCLVFEGGGEEVPLVRFVMVDPSSGTLILRNFGTSETDITNYRLCSNFNYSEEFNDGNISIVSGDLVLSPDEEVTLTWASSGGFLVDGNDMGLYLPSGGFGDPDNMMDFMQYLTTGNPREGVADEKGIWVAGTTVTGAFPYTFIGGAADFGVNFWEANTVISGCTDNEACNYDESATEDDGSCIVPTGCDFCFEGVLVDVPEIGDACDDGDPLTINDTIISCGLCAGSDVPEGCTDITACNYDEGAVINDGSCVFATGCDVCDGIGGITDNPEIGDACDDGNELTSNDVLTACDVCEGTLNPVLGCTDNTACNFDAGADSDDGTCIYATGCDVCDGAGGITDNPEIGDACDDGNELTSNDVLTACDVCEGTLNPILGCTDNTACNFDAGADTDDGTCIYATGCDVCDGAGEITDYPEIGDACDDGNELTSNDVLTACDVCEGTLNPILGCTDNTACNFDAGADTDDGTCIYATGCDVCDGAGGITNNPEIGDACDDGDANTENDVFVSCDLCQGTEIGCLAEAGSISTTSETTICAGDGISDIVNVDLVPGLGDNSVLLITDETGMILALLPELMADFEGAGAGVCSLYHITFIGSLTGLSAGENIADIEGCFALSSPIVVTRLSGDDCPSGCGAIAASISTTSETTICAGDGVSDIVNVDLVPGLGDNSVLLITDETGLILALLPELVADFEGAGAGVCSMYHITFFGTLTGLSAGENIADIEGCFALSSPIVVTRLSGDDCPTEFDCPDLMANVGDECDDGNDDLFPGTVNELCECEPGVPVYDCPALEADFGYACDDGDPNTVNDVVTTECVCEGTATGECTGIDSSIWGEGPWSMISQGTFVAQSGNDAILAKGDGDLSVEVFDGECGGTSLGVYNTVGAGEGSEFIERIVVGNLVAGQTYSYVVSGGTNVMTKVKTYANGRLRDNECPGSFNISNQIHALRKYQMYNNLSVQVTGFTYRFQDVVTGDVFVAVRNTVDGHSPQLSTIPGLQTGHTYNVQVKHRVLQIANGVSAQLYSDYGTPCTISIVGGVVSDCVVVPPTIWGTGPWTNVSQGTFVAQSSNDAVLAKGEGDLTVEVFLGDCGGTSIGMFNTVGAGTGNEFIERIVVGDLVAGQTYSYFVTGGTNVMSKVKTYADSRLRAVECPGTFNLLDKIHSLRENELYSNPVVQVTGFTFRFEDVITGDVFVAVRNVVDGHSPQLAAIPGLQEGHSYDVQVSHRVLQVANGMVAELYSDYGTTCTISINDGMDLIQGCTDPSACNYDAAANTNDGSCLLIGVACDDGDVSTENDIVGADCICAGVIPPFVDSSIGGSAVSQIEETIKADVYPNPNTGENVYVTMRNLVDADQMVTIEVMDVYGKKVFSEAYAINGSTMNQELVFNNDLASGLYLVQISANGQTVTQKLTIK